MAKHESDTERRALNESYDWRSFVPGWRAGLPLLACEELGPGSGSRVWRVTAQGGSRVFKQRTMRDAAINEERRHWLRQAAAVHGLAPAQLWYDADSGCELDEDCAGVAVTSQSFTESKFLVRLAQRLRDLHSVALPDYWRSRTDWRFDILQHLQNRLERNRHLLNTADIDHARAVLADAPRALHAIGGERRPVAILHLDIHAGNVLDADDLTILDWDYAAVGDPLWDLASIATSHPQVMAHAAEVLVAAGRSTDTTVAQWRLAQSLFALLSQLWTKEHGQAPV